MKYTIEELDHAANEDLLADAVFAEQQATDGPLYPDRGITRESLLAYATKCRAKMGPSAHARLIDYRP